MDKLTDDDWSLVASCCLNPDPAADPGQAKRLREIGRTLIRRRAEVAIDNAGDAIMRGADELWAEALGRSAPPPPAADFDTIKRACREALITREIEQGTARTKAMVAWTDEEERRRAEWAPRTTTVPLPAARQKALDEGRLFGAFCWGFLFGIAATLLSVWIGFVIT